MSDLLKLSDEELLKHKDVVDAYYAMMPFEKWMHNTEQVKIGQDSSGLYAEERCSKCGATWVYHTIYGYCDCDFKCSVPDPIPGPIERVAFQMRNACVAKNLAFAVYLAVDIMGCEFAEAYSYEKAVNLATPGQWICAAVEAWKGTK